MYRCKGYGAIIAWRQLKGKSCPSIDPESGLVNTNEIDPKCGGPDPRDCKKQPKTQPATQPIEQPAKKPWWTLPFLDPVSDWLTDRWDELRRTVKNGPPTGNTNWGPVPGPTPVPVFP
jgi:hypothetical protein